MDCIERLDNLFTEADAKGYTNEFVTAWLNANKDTKEVITEEVENLENPHTVILKVGDLEISLFDLLIEDDLLSTLFDKDEYADCNFKVVYLLLEFNDPNYLEVLLDMYEQVFNEPCLVY